LDNEVVVSTPTETRLANATKVSGRTNDGWGLGILNAMSLASNANVEDTSSLTLRKVLVQPFTNYNVSVVDKTLKNNSYISLINSNVSMVDNPFRANVTATEFQLRDKSKTFAIKGKGGVSSRGAGHYETGFYTSLGLFKNRGKLQYGVVQNVWSDKYNPNDLGYLRQNNHVNTESYVQYQKTEPSGILKEYYATLWWDYYRMFNPNTFCNTEIGSNLNVSFMNNYFLGLNGGYSSDKFDYKEPRAEGRYYHRPDGFWYNIYIGSDSRKKVYCNFQHSHSQILETGALDNSISSNVRILIGQRFQFNYGIYYNNTKDDVGFVDKDEVENTIYFAARDNNQIENVWSVNYVVNNRMNIRLRGRHNWASSANKSFFRLLQNGTLIPDDNYSENMDQNFNAFTVDMIFRWIFSPGSEFICAWKNAAYADRNRVVRNYWENLSDTWANQSNSLSVKILYYVDYNSLKKRT
jgi:hypothetical protein